MISGNGRRINVQNLKYYFVLLIDKTMQMACRNQKRKMDIYGKYASDCLTFFKIWNADDYLIARYRASEYLVECQAVENAPPPPPLNEKVSIKNFCVPTSKYSKVVLFIIVNVLFSSLFLLILIYLYECRFGENVSRILITYLLGRLRFYILNNSSKLSENN